MLSLIVVVVGCIVGGLFLGIRIKAGPYGMITVMTLCTACGIFCRSPYLTGLALDQYVPLTRSKQIQRSLEQTYIATQTGGRINLVIDYKKATDEIRQAVLTGLKRVGDDDQLRRAELILALSKFGGDDLCGSFFTGDVDSQQLGEALKQLPDEEYNAWVRISQTALQMELQLTPFPKVSNFTFNEALESMVESLPEPDRIFLKQKFSQAAANKPIPAGEACKATGLLYTAVIKKGPPTGSRFMRYSADLTATGTRNTASDIKPTAKKEPTTHQLTPIETEALNRGKIEPAPIALPIPSKR